MMKALSKLSSKSKFIAVGLMSGTSLDGIDAALVEITGSGGDMKVALIEFLTLPYSREMREFILKNSNADTAKLDEICGLNFVLGEAFASAALEVIHKAGKEPPDVDFIGSHGQTIYHLPSPAKLFGKTVRSTLQIGEPAVIAARTGIIIVSDFRKADMAAGGEGAPLIPYVDKILFSSEKGCEVALNIGGIANITFLPPEDSDAEIIAFDTGPGNMIIDGLVARFTGDEKIYDDGGAIALSGKVQDDLLARMMEHPFLEQSIPKSTGRESFGSDYIDWVIEAGRDRDWRNLVATAAAFTAKAVTIAVRKYLEPVHPIDKLIISGGGARNRAIVKALEEDFSDTTIMTSDKLGIPVDAKEAIGFAVLAAESIRGIPSNVPSATGAGKSAILGNITIPSISS